jgi:uncharacterized membrane protein YbhN (UPF0104 family)
MSIGRHPRDGVVLFIASCVVLLCSLATQARVVNPVEVAIFGQFAQIPEASTPVWRVLTWAGSWVGIAAVTAAALYLKRIRLALQCAGAGVLAWGLARVLDGLVGGRSVPAQLLGATGVRLPVTGSFAFPAPHAAVAAAMVALAAPYLLRARYRSTAWVLAVLVAAADVYLGTSLPLGAFAAVFLGWGIGALFHLVWGAPGRRTSEAAVCRALERAGMFPVEAVPVRKRLGAPLEFGVTTEAGDRLRVEVVRRLHRRGGPWYRLRRLLASLEVEDVRLSSRYHETEHEALVALFAQRAGVNTPAVVLACETRHGSPLLVRRQVDGRRLAEMSGAEIDESLLDAIWAQIAALGEARIAHHDLCAENILVDAHGTPWLLNFSVGVIGADSARTAQDIAETLVSLASRVGIPRTVRSACRVLSPDRLEPALPYLQPLALPRRNRKQLLQQRYMLADLRETLAEQIARPIPTFRSPVRATTVIGLLLLGGAVYTLLPQLSSMQAVIASLSNANWGWLAVATLCGFVAIVPSAVSLIGSSATPLPFWRTNVVQLAAAFTGRTTPGGVGFFGINIAFMERIGIRRSSAVGVTMLNMAATGAIGAILGLIGIFGIGISGLLHGVHIPLGWPVLAAAGGVLVAATAVLFSPFGRRKVVRPGLRVTRELLSALRQPLRAVQLIGGATGYLLISGLGLAATLAAFDTHVPVVAVIVVFIVGNTLGHIAPIPGGLGPTEALTIAGLTALGTAPTVAVATVLTMRLLTYWLPVLPGIATFRYLQHHNIV